MDPRAFLMLVSEYKLYCLLVETKTDQLPIET